MVTAKDLKLEVTPAARTLLAARGYDPVYGARPLKRVIQRLLQNPIAMKVLEGAYQPGDTVLVDARNDAIDISRRDGHLAKAANG